MRLIGVLCWYDERPSWLAGVVAGLAQAGCHHVVAVDGAYALYPDARASSPVEQHRVIAEVCVAMGMGYTIHTPQEPFFGNEVEKRTLSLRLAETIAGPDDWYFVVDADHFVQSAIGHLAVLENTDADVAAVRLVEGNSFRGFPCRCVFRAIPGLRYEGNHYTVLTPDGRNLIAPTEPCADLSRIVVAHRTGQRDPERTASALAYAERRDVTGAEREAVVVLPS